MHISKSCGLTSYANSFIFVSTSLYIYYVIIFLLIWWKTGVVQGNNSSPPEHILPNPNQSESTWARFVISIFQCGKYSARKRPISKESILGKISLFLTKANKH